MENKYFTPDIEDICIGYELEMNWNRAYEEKWVPVKISIQDEEFVYTDEISDIINALDDGMSEARVLYLTKEQIEAEGWEFEKGQLISDDRKDFRRSINKSLITNDTLYKYDILLKYNPETNQLIIENDADYNMGYETYFKGECKDINTFRKIIKLLGI